MTIKIEKGNEEELNICFTYDYERIEKIKKIKGHRWNPKLKHWIVPNNEEVLRELSILFFDEEIIIDPSLTV